MEFQVEREAILKPLQMVSGVVEKRQTQPILANVLLQANSHLLTVTGTDLEVELLARLTLTEPAETGAITIPAKKFIDICKSLPAESVLKLSHQDHQLTIRSGRSRFTLVTLPADDFPGLDELPGEFEFSLLASEMRYLIENTHFSMAQNDVRYYLNGLYLDIKSGVINAVATDGHRLAWSHLGNDPVSDEYSVIIPRKGIVELLRLLNDDSQINVTLTKNHIRITAETYVFTSKLIDGRFPEYERVIPQNCEKNIIVDRDTFRETLQRVAILSNEKYRGVRLQVRENQMHLLANNPEQEEAEEEVEIKYQGEAFDVGFNVSYLIDALSHLPAGDVTLSLVDAKSSMKIQSLADPNRSYVIMPMRV